MTKEQEDQGFRVTDKRIFSEDGNVRPDVPQEPGPQPARQSNPKTESAPGMEGPIDFPSYVLTYYTQGLVLLGEVPNPYTNKTEQNLDGVRYTVDILSMLKEKTKGNLSADEDKLLDSVLYELRMKYMSKVNPVKLK